MRTLLSFILLQLCVLAAAAHDVYGRVVDPDGQPIAYAFVSAEGAGRQFVAAKDGTFVLRGVDAGNYNIKIRHIGFQTFERSLNVSGGRVEMGDCVLEVTPIELGEVIAFADETTMEQYILHNMQKHGRRLKDVCPDYTCDGRFTLFQDYDYSVLPKRLRNIILSVATLHGRRSANLFLMGHPLIDVTVEAQIISKNGKPKAGKGYVTHSNFALTDKDEEGLMQIVTFVPGLYDAFNDPKEGYLGTKYNKAPKWTYKGSYEENGRTIYILETDYVHIEVVKDLWCIRAARQIGGLFNSTYNEYIFDEVRPDVFLPVAFVQKERLSDADDAEIGDEDWAEMKQEAHDNPERLQTIDDMQQRFARGEKSADVICLITFKYS